MIFETEWLVTGAGRYVNNISVLDTVSVNTQQIAKGSAAAKHDFIKTMTMKLDSFVRHAYIRMGVHKDGGHLKFLI